MGGAVVVFLSFQLQCTYMKQFPRQRAGASHHLHDASARNVNTSTLRASLLSSPRRTQTQHHLHKCKIKDTKTHGLFQTVGQLLVMFIHFLPLFHLSALGVTSFWFWPTNTPRCWAPTSSRLDRWLLLLLLLIRRYYKYLYINIYKSL